MLLSSCFNATPVNKSVIVPQENPVIVIVGSIEPNWPDLVTVTDVEDGSITDFYFDNFFVNLDVVVPYMVTYSATDSGGYTTTFPLTVKVEQLADVLFEKVLNAKITNNYPYLEPSVLSAIKALREPYEVKMPPYNEAKMLNKVKGA